MKNILLLTCWSDDFEGFLVLQWVTEPDFVLGKDSDEVLAALREVLDLQPLDL